jgi:hypothetical protein
MSDAPYLVSAWLTLPQHSGHATAAYPSDKLSVLPELLLLLLFIQYGSNPLHSTSSSACLSRTGTVSSCGLSDSSSSLV